MNFLRKIIKFITNKQFRFSIMSSYGFYNRVPDKKYLKKVFILNGGYVLNLDKPQSFNEKLNWIKINDRNPLYTRLADKYDAKKFVADNIGEKYVVRSFGVYNSVDDIDIGTLPNRFVIKATHDSSGAVICKDKESFDLLSFKKKYSKIMRRNFYNRSREWPYKNITPRIIVDELLEDNTFINKETTLIDYKFWCFNGEPKIMYVTVKSSEIFENFYDTNFNPVDINHGFPRHVPEFEKPKNFEKMLDLSRILAKKTETSFVRIDFFNINGSIFFGEFTFFDWGGLRPFSDKDTDLILGKMIKLPIDD